MSPRFHQSVSLIEFIIGVSITIGGGLLTAGYAWATINDRVSHVEQKAEKIDELSNQMTEVRTDVKWIRKALDGYGGLKEE